jgi:type VI secretion system protein ImpF
MAEIGTRDAIQPALLDRLTDHNPPPRDHARRGRPGDNDRSSADSFTDVTAAPPEHPADGDDRRPARESRDERVMTKTELREAVLRDLGWLFNTTNAAAGLELDHYPLAAQSTLNYGLPAFSGKPLSSVDLPRLETALREAILRFEPRILPHSLSVRSVRPTTVAGQHNIVSFEILGELWAQPYPFELLLKTDLDLESGEIRISEGR